ncbi:MAG: hypothetical protein QOG72_3127 [Sphingomonadales bacterium]|jgi:transcriptional regulator with XRE-family HTH domain|nr:hypothetical protein [Sphingomonadales bacterium]
MVNVEKYQQSKNGPLKTEVIAKLDSIRIAKGWSYKTLGEHLGISGPFAHAILNKPSNITTNTAMQKIAGGIERLESNDFSTPATPTEQRGDLVDHRFDLRQDLTVRLWLPANLTEREVERLGFFMRSLVA